MINAKELPEMEIFDELIAVADNSLVKQAMASGRIPVGYNCYSAPVPLMMVGGLFPLRMRAASITDTSVGSYYLSRIACSYTRSNLEAIANGTYNFLRAYISGGACVQMIRVAQHADYISPFKERIENGDFLVYILDSPNRLSDPTFDLYLADLKRAAAKLSEIPGVSFTDEALSKAIGDLNRHNALLKRISEYRKGKEPRIAGTEFHKVVVASLTCPKDLLEKPMENLIAALEKRQPITGYKARVMIAGPVLDNPEYTKLIEEQGALVVCDRYCFGSLPGMEPIPEVGDPWANMAKYYMETSECSKMMGQFEQRLEEKNNYIKEFDVDGVIMHYVKFCDLWAYEISMSIDRFLKAGIPAIKIEHDYGFSSAGQIKTRIQAFLEQVENTSLMSQWRKENLI
jgi:benzoyl-CoA reductase/2-hydroxyglutaryl-CoA dehydratase subunit BcrC/BadD/HgdB